MKAIEKLNVTADEFFKEITDSIIGDIKKTTNKSIHASQIKPGLNYKKVLPNQKVLPNRFKGNSEVTVRVLSCIPLKEYSSVFESDVDRTYVTYRIENILEDGIEASYEESYETKKGNGTISSQNGLFGQKYLDKQSFKKGKKLLKKIEDYIIQHRDK